MENVRLLKLYAKDMKQAKKKHAEKLQKNDPTSDLHLDSVSAPHGLSSPSCPSTPTVSSIIPLLSPVYIMAPHEFPNPEDYNKDRSPRMAGSDRSPKGERGLGDKMTLGSKRPPSPTKLADPTTMIMMFQSRCVL